MTGAPDRARSVRIQLPKFAVANASAVSFQSAFGQRQSASAQVLYKQLAQSSVSHNAITDYDASNREMFVKSASLRFIGSIGIKIRSFLSD